MVLWCCCTRAICRNGQSLILLIQSPFEITLLAIFSKDKVDTVSVESLVYNVCTTQGKEQVLHQSRPSGKYSLESCGQVCEPHAKQQTCIGPAGRHNHKSHTQPSSVSCRQCLVSTGKTGLALHAPSPWWAGKHDLLLLLLMLPTLLTVRFIFLLLSFIFSFLYYYVFLYYYYYSFVIIFIIITTIMNGHYLIVACLRHDWL